MTRFSWFWFVVVASVVASGRGFDLSKETPLRYALFNRLFSNYNQWMEPTSDPTAPLLLNVSIAISAISDVDEKSETITLMGWVDLWWVDEFLRWDDMPEYDSIPVLVIPSTKLWMPTLAFKNGVNNLFFATTDFSARLHRNGTVEFFPGGPVTLSCPFDLTYFPFDEQTCWVNITTWSHDVTQIQLDAFAMNLSIIQNNDQWRIVDYGEESYLPYSGVMNEDLNAYSEARFYIRIRRKPLFGIMNILFPIIMLSALNLAVFFVPANEGEKISLALTVLLSFSVWLLMLDGRLPSSSDYVPMISVFITAFMIMSCISVVVAVVVLQVNAKPETEEFPPWAARIVYARDVVYGKCRRRNRIKPLKIKQDLTWPIVAASMDQFFFFVFALLNLVMTIIIVCLLVAIGHP